MQVAQPNSPNRIAAAFQRVVFGFVLLLALGATTDLSKADVPGAPVVLLYVTIGVLAAVALIHLPPLFWRLPGRTRLAAYGALLGALVLFGTYLNIMKAAYDLTPQGAKEAAAEAAEQRRAAASQARDDLLKEKAAALDAATAQAEDEVRRLKGCMSMFGHEMPKLSEQVKEALQNPHAFEHVRTEPFPADAAGYNVQMEFRAENGFGALRTVSVRAKVDPSDCSVAEVGPIEN